MPAVSSDILDFNIFWWILQVREGLKSIWNGSGIHLDEVSAREVEYGIISKDSDEFQQDLHDFEQCPSILDSREWLIGDLSQFGLGAMGTAPHPDWDKFQISHFRLVRMLGSCSKSCKSVKMTSYSTSRAENSSKWIREPFQIDSRTSRTFKIHQKI